MPANIINNNNTNNVNRRGSIKFSRRGSMNVNRRGSMDTKYVDTSSSRRSSLSTKPRVMPRRGSLLTSRQANEILLDRVDCLSEKFQSQNFSLYDDSDDCASDIED